MDYPKVAVIVLNWNGVNDTSDCLESLKKLTYPDYLVIVVDNGSDGEDVRILKGKFGDYIHIIENDRNYGFAEGNNIGIRYALSVFEPAYFLLLNNDTIVAPDLLSELIKVAESDDRIGIAGPKIYYHDFKGRSDVIWYAGGKVREWRRCVYQHIGKDDDDRAEYQSIGEVDFVSGAAMMLKRRAIDELSLLNPRYFLGAEDVEYCLKARKHGLKVVYVPSARVWHKVGRSKSRRAPGFEFIRNHYRLVRNNFPLYVYIYQLFLLPLLLLEGFGSYVLRKSNNRTLAGFLSRFSRF